MVTDNCELAVTSAKSFEVSVMLVAVVLAVTGASWFSWRLAMVTAPSVEMISSVAASGALSKATVA